MKKLLYLCLCILSVHVFAQNNITKEDITQLVKEVETSVKTKDIKKMSLVLADDLKIIVDLPKEMGERVSLSKEEYLENLALGWSLPVTYEHDIKILNSLISKNKMSAIIKAVITEKVIDKGRIILDTRTDEMIEIIKDNGIVKIRRIAGKLYLKNKDKLPF